MKKIFNSFLGFCFCVLLATPAESAIMETHEFYLDNGLQVIVIPNHKSPIVKHMVWYKVGSTDEAPGKGGLAHLLEHLMFRGTKKVPDSAFNDIIARNGGYSNAFTSYDYTAYHQFVDVSRLEIAMALEADRMSGLTISEEAFARERDIVYQERQQRVSNSSAARFRERAGRVLWQTSPYARPLTGTNNEIMNLSRHDVIEFYRQYYAPDNAVLILSGDIDVDTARILAEKYYGKIKNKKGKQRPKVDFAVPEELSRYRVTGYVPDIQTPRIFREYIVPSISDNPKKTYALMVLSDYLGESVTSYLHMQLVATKRAVAASSSYSGIKRGPGSFSFLLVPLPDMSVREAEVLLDETIRNAISSLTPEILEKVKKNMVSGQVYVRDNAESAALLAGQFAAIGLPLSILDDYEKNIMAVSMEDVLEAYQSVQENSTSMTALMLPEDYEEKIK